MKKSLSILLALLMILSSLPVMTFAASAEEAVAGKADTNVLANHTVKDFGKWRWNTITDNNSIAKGDDTSDILVKFPGSQNIFTTATLLPNTEYSFDFSWYSKNVDGGMSSPVLVDIYPVEDGVNVYDTNVYIEFDAGNDANKTDYNAATEEEMANFNKCVWYEGIMPANHPKAGERYNGYLPAIYGGDYGTDLVKSEYHEQRMNDVWRSSTAKFTTTEHTNYIIIVGFGTQGGAITDQELYLADFSLMNPDYIPLEDKRPGNWDTFRWTRVDPDYTPVTIDGITSEMYVNSCISHRVFTTIPAKAFKENEISFKYYSGNGITVSGICVYPDTVGGDIHSKMDTTGNGWLEGYYDAESNTYIGDQWLPEGKTGTNYYAQFVPGRLSANPSGIQTQRTCGADASTTWQTATAKFPSTGADFYHVIIEFSGNTNTGNTCHFADFKHTGTGLSKEGNLLDSATYANGSVSFLTSAKGYEQAMATGEEYMEPRMSFASGLDNYNFSVNGGYAWGFGFGTGYLGGNTNNPTDLNATPWPLYNHDEHKHIFGYVNIKAKGLKADATYDFSYIYKDGQRFKIDSIKNENGTATYIVEPAYTELVGAANVTKGAEKATALFTVPADGDYVITLKANRSPEYNPSFNTYSTTVLCDLELYEKGAMYNVSVSKEGNGAASADNTGLVEEGTVVTLTAKAELFERFLGWYVGDTLLSKDATYNYTIDGDTTIVGKFSSYGENLMANYDTSKFVARYWGNVLNAESRYGGLGIRADKVPHQALVTKANLEAGKEYTLSFEWKSVENISNKDYVTSIKVCKILTPEIDVLGNKDDTWADGSGYKGQFGEDIEVGGGYSSQEIANTCTWQNITTTFTPTESGEYAIIINFGHNTLTEEEVAEINRVHGSNLATHANNNQSVDLSDFVLKTKPEITYTGTKYDWHGERWAKVSDSEDTKDGGYAYEVKDAMSQSISTTLKGLKPGTNYKFSFNWKAVNNEKGLAFVQAVPIYSANSGNPVHTDNVVDCDGSCNYEHYGEGANVDFRPSYIPNEGYENLTSSLDNPNGTSEAADDALTNWNTVSGTFATTDDADYYFFIVFGLKGNISSQAVIISDLVVEEVVEGTAPAGDDMIAHPGVSIRKNTESAYGQALRYKFIIDGDVIANAQADGYELVEYGTVVALVDDLAGHAADPILNATSYTVRTGVAYDTANGINKQFAVDANGNVTYTAALYNIPTANYGADIAVRPYAKFQNANGESYIRYGTTRIASVFAVVEEVLAGSNADDISYVNNTMLVGDVLNAYNEWLANK
ncbi:MAG: hypothetical protein E7551_07615 [Ruminococcaceae bacterium]|nr:hypothetical protein [Oscillospiraceae bacterium]